MELERLYRERGGMDKSWLKYWLQLEAASRLKYNHGSTQKRRQSTFYVERIIIYGMTIMIYGSKKL